MDRTPIGFRLRKQREFMVLTREQLAERIAVRPIFCSDIELGVKGIIVSTLCKLAKSLMLESRSDTEYARAEKLLKVFVSRCMMRNE